jgi:hypothetical protein
MLGSVRPERKTYLPLLGPVMIFIPQLFGEEGNRHRIRFIGSRRAFAACSGCVPSIDKIAP